MRRRDGAFVPGGTEPRIVIRHNAGMASVPAPASSALIRPLLTGVASLCWVVQFFSVESVAPQVAPLFQATLAAAWAMLLLWTWTRLRGIPLFAQGASLPVALWGGGLFAAQWGCLYLAVARAPALDVALDYGVLGYLALSVVSPAAPGRAGRWRPRLLESGKTVFCLLPALAAAGLLAWRGLQTGGGEASVLLLVAALCFALDARLARRAGAGSEDTLRWRFYQLCVAALLLPMVAVVFSPTWNFNPGLGGLAAIGLQAVCGGLALPLLRGMAQLQTAAPQPSQRRARGAPALGLLAAPLWIMGIALAAGGLGLASTPDRVQLAATALLALAVVCSRHRATGWMAGMRARRPDAG